MKILLVEDDDLVRDMLTRIGTRLSPGHLCKQW